MRGPPHGIGSAITEIKAVKLKAAAVHLGEFGQSVCFAFGVAFDEI
jgi:hypothetical protein